MNEEESQALRDLGRIARDARESLELSQEQVAELLGVVHSTISRFENGKNRLRRRELARLFVELQGDLEQLNLERAFVQTARRIPGYEKFTPETAPELVLDDEEKDESLGDEIRLDLLVRPSRDLRRSDVDVIRSHTRPILLRSSDVLLRARASFLRATSYQEEALPEELKKGISYAVQAERLALSIGELFLSDLAAYYRIVLERKLVDVTSLNLSEYARLRNEAENLAANTRFAAIEVMACAEMAKYAISWGSPSEIDKWLELGKAANVRAITQDNLRRHNTRLWPLHTPAHAHHLIWDAVLRAHGTHRSSLEARREAVSRLDEQPEGQSTNLHDISIPLSLAEAGLQSSTSDQALQNSALWVERLRRRAKLAGELKQELRAQRIIARLPDDLRYELTRVTSLPFALDKNDW